MARFSAAHYENTTDFLDARGIDYDPGDLAAELADLTRAEQAQAWEIIDSGDYEAWVDFCQEHGIQYHG